jgi:hypothetical protein
MELGLSFGAWAKMPTANKIPKKAMFFFIVLIY